MLTDQMEFVVISFALARLLFMLALFVNSHCLLIFIRRKGPQITGSGAYLGRTLTSQSVVKYTVHCSYNNSSLVRSSPFVLILKLMLLWVVVVVDHVSVLVHCTQNVRLLFVYFLVIP